MIGRCALAAALVLLHAAAEPSASRTFEFSCRDRQAPRPVEARESRREARAVSRWASSAGAARKGECPVVSVTVSRQPALATMARWLSSGRIRSRVHST